MSRTFTETERYAREAEDRISKLAARDAANVAAFQKRTNGFAPVVQATERSAIATESSKALVEQAEIGYTQRDRMLEARAKRRAAKHAKAERAPRDERSTAQKIADKYDPEIEV